MEIKKEDLESMISGLSDLTTGIDVTIKNINKIANGDIPDDAKNAITELNNGIFKEFSNLKSKIDNIAKA